MGGPARLPTTEEKQEEGTALTAAGLQHIGHALYTPPADFDLNPKIARQLEAKRAMFERGQGMDWATGEALAFGGLLLDGHRVRLSGEDCSAAPSASATPC